MDSFGDVRGVCWVTVRWVCWIAFLATAGVFLSQSASSGYLGAAASARGDGGAVHMQGRRPLQSALSSPAHQLPEGGQLVCGQVHHPWGLDGHKGGTALC